MDVSVVIVSYNTRQLLKACLESIYSETRGISFEVIVVDNASSDDSAGLVADRFPAVKLIALEVNEGFGRAVNRAAAQSSGDTLMLLNPDTVVRDGAVQALFHFACERPGHGIYGGRTLAPNGSVDPSSCWGRLSPWSLFCFASGLSTLLKRSRIFDPESLGRWQRDSVREVDVVTGCLCLIERSVWDSLGGFDPRYFMFGEDFDLSMRASRRGWRPIITPSATITHFVGASSVSDSNRKLQIMRAKATLVRLHFSPLARPFGIAFLAGGVALRAWGSRAAGLLTHDGAGESWSEVWAQRDLWLAGYAPVKRRS